MVSLSRMSAMWQLMEEFVRCDTIFLSRTWFDENDSSCRQGEPRWETERQWHTITSFSLLFWLLPWKKKRLTSLNGVASVPRCCSLLHLLNRCIRIVNMRETFWRESEFHGCLSAYQPSKALSGNANFSGKLRLWEGSQWPVKMLFFLKKSLFIYLFCMWAVCWLLWEKNIHVL